MINWPDNPTNGQEHIEEGTVWVYRDPPGCWEVGASSGGVQQIVDDDGSSYVVIGNTLICFGWSNGTDNDVFQFKKEFAAPPAVTLTIEASAPLVVGLSITNNSITTTQFGISSEIDPGDPYSTDFGWVAIGPAREEDKQPTEITTSAPVEEFHDPTGAASWRIIGRTLECWGAVTIPASTGNIAVVFPQTFKNVPSFSTVGNTGSARYSSVGSPTVSGVDIYGYTVDGSAPTSDYQVFWQAIGEVGP